MGNGRAYIQYNVKKLGLFGDERRSVPLETVPAIRDELMGRDDRKDSKMAHFELLTEEDMAEIDRVIKEATAEIQRLRMAEDEQGELSP